MNDFGGACCGVVLAPNANDGGVLFCAPKVKLGEGLAIGVEGAGAFWVPKVKDGVEGDVPLVTGF